MSNEFGSKIEHIIGKNNDYIEDVSKHTPYKIKFVSEYVKEWLYVVVHNNTNINFIDCMCNAGVYKNGIFCTAIYVADIFLKAALKYPEKQFNIYLNDLSSNRIKIIKEIISAKFQSAPRNLNFHFDNIDVNEYIQKNTYNKMLNSFKSKTILYVDPYNFKDVDTTILAKYISKNYCEVIYNLFTSDVSRNYLTGAIDGRHFKTIKDFCNYIEGKLKIGKMGYCYFFPFRISTNIELYKIMYITPSPKGLDKLKTAIWKIFDGALYYVSEKGDEKQIPLLDHETSVDTMAKYHATEAINLIRKKFGNSKEISYRAIENYIRPKTVLKDSQIIEYIIKYCMKNNIMIKLNKVATRYNYKDDYYIIKGTR